MKKIVAFYVVQKILEERFTEKRKKKLHRGGCLKFKAIYQSKSFLFFEKKKKNQRKALKIK